MPYDDLLVCIHPKVLRQPILDTLKDAYWCELGVYNAGRTEEEAEPRIVITTPHKKKSDWNLGERNRKVCAKNGASNPKTVISWGVINLGAS